MDYTTYVAQLSTLMGEDPTEANFVTILPAIIQSAEQRIFRDLDMLGTVVQDSTVSTTAGARILGIPTAFVVVTEICVITPASTAPAAGTRNPLTPQSLQYLDLVWPSTAGATVPVSFAMIDQWHIALGPVPDDSYVVEITGTQFPVTLSADNPDTFIADNLPDLFLAASMIFAAGYMKNYGAQADDPQMGMSWDAQYKELLTPALAQETRKKWQAVAWSSQSPAPLASPPRG